MNPMIPDGGKSDVKLMLEVRQGKECAFEILHERYQRKLIAFFYNMSRNPSMANDLCQETFLRIWRVRRRYRATGSFPAYLFGIARLIWMEACRSQRKVWRLGTRVDMAGAFETQADPDAAPDRLAARTELETVIFEALESLPEEQRMVFAMRNIEGLSLEDIAAALDCPINTVRSRRILAVKKLRHLLAAFYEPSVRGASRD